MSYTTDNAGDEILVDEQKPNEELRELFTAVSRNKTCKSLIIKANSFDSELISAICQLIECNTVLETYDILLV